jgi:Ca2+-binding RTX toxin-like protein
VGNDVVYAWLGTDFVRGGTGNDQLFGDDGHDIMLGEDGDDVLNGGAGRDVLIGGHNADQLNGGADDDILIAGTTSHDANDAALQSVLAEWTSARSYQTRVKNLQNKGNGPDFQNRLNGDVFLISKGENVTVFDDDALDSLTGNDGDDWFLYDKLLDTLTDWVGGEQKN